MTDAQGWTGEGGCGMKRHQDVLAISDGACNVRGIARSLVEAADAAAHERGRQEKDSAVRLIVDQLAFLCGVGGSSADWDSLREDCRAKVAAEKGGAA